MVIKSIPKFIFAFVLIVLGVIFTQVIAAQTNLIDGANAVSGESFSLASLRASGGGINNSAYKSTANTGAGWISGSVAIVNATGTLNYAGNYTVDYPNQRISFINSTFMSTGLGGINNNTLVSYQYYPTGYVGSDFGATALSLIAGFMALAVLGIGIALVFGIFRDYRIV